MTLCVNYAINNVLNYKNVMLYYINIRMYIIWNFNSLFSYIYIYIYTWKPALGVTLMCTYIHSFENNKSQFLWSNSIDTAEPMHFQLGLWI